MKPSSQNLIITTCHRHNTASLQRVIVTTPHPYNVSSSQHRILTTCHRHNTASSQRLILSALCTFCYVVHERSLHTILKTYSDQKYKFLLLRTFAAKQVALLNWISFLASVCIFMFNSFKSVALKFYYTFYFDFALPVWRPWHPTWVWM